MARHAAAATAEPAGRPDVARQAPAPAKVNLYLHVVGRRADGLHELDSLVAFADIGDDLTLQPGLPLDLHIEGPYAAALEGGDDNLVRRAARWLAARAERPPEGRFQLVKRLPVASGIGGGSADAAAALRLLADAWRYDLAAIDNAELAGALGADLPVCLAGGARFVGGIGEDLTAVLALPSLPAVLANPGVAVSTGTVFARLAGVRSAPARFDVPPDPRALIGELAARRNDLEAPAAALAPEIRETLAALRAQPGARLARMSGSGATCFALFDDEAAAAAAVVALAAAYPRWWVKATRIGGAC